MWYEGVCDCFRMPKGGGKCCLWVVCGGGLLTPNLTSLLAAP